MANTTNFLGASNNNNNNKSSSVMGVPKSSTIDLMEEMAAKGLPLNNTPYSPMADKENSYYNLNTVEFIRNGDNATAKPGPSAARKPATGGNATKDANAGGWFANISLQNPFEKN